MKALIISADGFEDMELFFPYYRMQEEDIKVDIASFAKSTIKGKHGYLVNVDLTLNNVRSEEYDILLLPGGTAPQKLRTDERVSNIAKHFFEYDKPVGTICHGPQILISADLVRGRKATCYHSVKGELMAAGAEYRDQEVVVDGNLISSRQPSDLPAFLRELMKKVKSS